LIDKYKKRLETIKSRKEYQALKTAALQEGVSITDNGGFIS
jgi:hypothetical protein